MGIIYDFNPIGITKTAEQPIVHEYFYVETAVANNPVFWVKGGSSGNPDPINMGYSVDEKTTWDSYVFGSTQITLQNVGDRVYFKNSTGTFSNGPNDFYRLGAAGGAFKVGGYIISLIDDTMTATSMPSCAFNNLFEFNSVQLDASALEMPDFTSNNCYNSMFKNCTGQLTAPNLPATVCSPFCYYGMFDGCTGLIYPPIILATTLDTGCYTQMFRGCTSLQYGPTLSATTLVTNCYMEMFSGCTSLTAAPNLPAPTLANSCYLGMFAGCTNLTSMNIGFTAWNDADSATNWWLANVAAAGTFTCGPNIGWASPPRDTSHIPEGWTINVVT